MAQVTIQTARLARGSHEGPERGICAMELVSMLAGEPFGDRCAGVCPVLAAFVRGYNDGIDARRRQDLIRLAPELLGTDAGADAARIRAGRCFALAAEAHATSPLRLLPARFPHDDEVHNLELAGRFAARAARRRAGWHERSLAFLSALTRIGTPPAPAPAVAPPPLPACGRALARA